ncbi:MAG: cytosine deaminase [Microcoleaceae cyanobacterium]
MRTLMIPSTSHYWLKNAHVPLAVLSDADRSAALAPNSDHVVLVDLEIQSGLIAQVLPAAKIDPGATPAVDLQKRLVWPCFVDLHTHLDKGHIWERSPNPDGTFQGAIAAAQQDIKTHWDADDLYRRMEFGLKCSYAHGTKAIRTHLDSSEPIGEINWEVFKALQTEWSDRLILQAASLVTLDYYLTPAGEKLADRVAELGGILGGVADMNPEIDRQIEQVFAIAKDRGLNLDFHADENNNPNSITLFKIAKAALQSQFSGQIICGHCCSLAVQPPSVVTETLMLVKQAQIGIVSLPMCNLYLQDRQYSQQSIGDFNQSYPRTPRWRGITLLHELKQSGIPVAVASDNCRDPFYGFGDHDGLEVFVMAVRIAHLDRPYGDWPQIITQTPAQLMGLSGEGQIGSQRPADLILFQGRSFSELLARPHTSRTVIRNGKIVEASLPNYTELDTLLDEDELNS